MGWEVAVGIATSVGAALGFKPSEQRIRDAERDRLMEESARTLEELKRERAQELSVELPASEPSLPRKEPGGNMAPLVDPETRAPRSAPGAPEGQELAEPDDDVQSPLAVQNPHGQHGKPDHQATVERLKDLARQEFPNAQIEAGNSIYKYTHVNRRPDVWAFDPVTEKVLKVYEAARINPDGSLPKREQLKKIEYDRAGIPNYFEPVIP